MSSGFNKIQLTLLAAFLAVTSLLYQPEAGRSFPALFGLLSVGVMAFLLTASNGRVFIRKDDSVMLPLLFFSLCLAEVETAFFSVFSVVGMLLCLSICYMTRFLVTDEKRKLFFFAELFMACAVPLLPCMLWVFILTSLIVILIKRADFIAYSLMASAALILPFIYWGAFSFIMGQDVAGVFCRFVSDLSLISPSIGRISVVKLFYETVMAYFLVRSIIFTIYSRNSSLFVTGDYAVHYWLWLWICYLIIAALYGLPSSDAGMYFGISAIPFSLLAFNFVTRQKGGANTFLFLLVFSIIAYRLSVLFL